MRNLHFIERPLQFSEIAYKSLGSSNSLSSLFFFSLCLIPSLASPFFSPQAALPFLPPSLCCSRPAREQAAPAASGPGADAQMQGARAAGRRRGLVRARKQVVRRRRPSVRASVDVREAQRAGEPKATAGRAQRGQGHGQLW
jgi:hypothetical protein